MKLSTAAVAVASLAGFAAAQNSTSSYGAGLVSALNAAGLTVLATLVQSQPDLASQLQTGGNYTVFLPSNTAITNLLASLNGAIPNATVISNILRYHITPGTLPQSAITATHIVAGSLLNAPLLGGPAPLTIYRSASQGPVVLTAARNIPIGANATYQNLLGHVVDTVLPVPVDAAQTLQLANLTALSTALTQAIPSAPQLLASTPKLTIFAPSNAALASMNATIASLSSTQLRNALLNHVINGTVVFSTNITNATTAQSANGQTFRFSFNNGSAYVQSGNSTPVRISRPDIPASNAVIHQLDGVLANIN